MAAAAEGADRVATAATPTSTTTSRFASVCGALSRYVKAAELARLSRPPPMVRPLPLMPGADVDAAPESREEAHQQVGPPPAKLTVVYGGRVLVIDDVTADKATALLQVAVAAAAPGAKTVNMPVARKASLQRFMEKRKDRIAARREPYLRPGASTDRHDGLTLAL